jgi:hypothetical protein
LIAVDTVHPDMVLKERDRVDRVTLIYEDDILTTMMGLGLREP